MLNNFRFTNMKFGNKWASDFNLVVVAPGDRYSFGVEYDFQDALLSIPGKSNTSYFGTSFTGKQLSITFAFDNVTQETLRDIKQWLSPNKVDKIIFDYSPYRHCIGKVSSNPQISFLPFKQIETKNKISVERTIYKGEIAVEFLFLSANFISGFKYYEDVFTELGEAVPKILPDWITESNLLSSIGEAYYITKNIKTSSFYLDNLSVTDTLFIENSGNDNSKLYVSFKLLNNLTDNGLNINIYTYDFGNNVISDTPFVQFHLNRFDNYKPFMKYWVGQDADWTRWKIIVDPYAMEVLIVNVSDATKIVNLGVQSSTNSFLYLKPINKVNYFKPFTSFTDNKNCPLEQATLNKVEISQNVSKINFEYKHTYI